MTRQEEIIQLRLEQESIKFYYVESLNDYWVGRRIGNFYYATWHRRFGFIWSHSKYLPWGEHIVDENTWWKEHTYPSEPKEIPFTEWIIGFIKKHFQQEPKHGKWIEDGCYPYYVCNNCGQVCEEQSNGVAIEPLFTNYCPNCGAIMESEE